MSSIFGCGCSSTLVVLLWAALGILLTIVGILLVLAVLTCEICSASLSIVRAQTCICIYPDGGAACDECLEWLRFQIQLAVQLGTQRQNPTAQNGLKHGTWNFTLKIPLVKIDVFWISLMLRTS